MPAQGEHVTLRQVTRREPASRGATRQLHPCFPHGPARRASLLADELTLAALITSATPAPTSPSTRSTPTPRSPTTRTPGPQPAEESRRRARRRAEAATGAAKQPDASPLELRSPAPGHAALLTHQQLS